MITAWDYTDTHVAYMHLNQANKAARGNYDGRPLPPGLVIPRAIDKMHRKPVLYALWAEKMQWVYNRLKALDWHLPPLPRIRGANKAP